ncbi:MAG: 6-phosphofructokinase [Verrucomicrobiae bacterium]|nr:6-phosphofructokinase [Verrucomicrobiae bacterium]
MKKKLRIGVLTAGGDCPGLNAAIRAVGKAAVNYYGWEVIGIRDGFRGLVEENYVRLDKSALAGILTIGGTILGTSRDRPHRMLINGEERDMTDVIVRNYKKLKLDALVCIGGGGTQKSALRLAKKGLNIITLPKTIDNDVPFTDTSLGFDTALSVATEAIDRLHSTAHSHHRIVVAELMGHRAGWLALGAGVAGGADVILIPEIPYDVNKVAEAIKRRSRHGTNFSIVAVAEGAMSEAEAAKFASAHRRKEAAKTAAAKARARAELVRLDEQHSGNTLRLAEELEKLTGLESRVTILGYVQRGGTPSTADRLLATRLGTACVHLIKDGVFEVMVAARGDNTEPVPLETVAGVRKQVPLDHPWITAARKIGTCFGD